MIIRPAIDADWPRIGELCERLVRAHHTYDPSRFIPLEALRGETYVSRVREALAGGRATVFVADVGGGAGGAAGYVFASIEPKNWKELRNEAGYVHDLVVDEAFRRTGLGAALLDRAIGWFESRGVGLILLWTAPQNRRAQSLFRRAGFRPTMVEMSLTRTRQTAGRRISRNRRARPKD